MKVISEEKLSTYLERVVDFLQDSLPRLREQSTEVVSDPVMARAEVASGNHKNNTQR